MDAMGKQTLFSNALNTAFKIAQIMEAMTRKMIANKPAESKKILLTKNLAKLYANKKLITIDLKTRMISTGSMQNAKKAVLIT